MPRSMTGYGRAAVNCPEFTAQVEIRAVNSRSLEVNIRLPQQLWSLESRIRRLVGEHVCRGHVDLLVEMRWLGERNRTVELDKGLAIAYHKALREIAQILDIPENFGAVELARIPEMIKVKEASIDAQTVWAYLGPVVREALEELNQSREAEGARMVADLQVRAGTLEGMLARVEAVAGKLPGKYAEKLERRLVERGATGLVDAQRLAAEVLFYSERSDITEEIVRWKSHLSRVRECLERQGPVGKELDFLSQELFREVNTIGAKGGDLEIAGEVIAAKGEIEKMREQAHNLE